MKKSFFASLQFCAAALMLSIVADKSAPAWATVLAYVIMVINVWGAIGNLKEEKE